MSTDTEPAAAAAGAEPPFSVDELLDLPLGRGDAAAHLRRDRLYIVVRDRDAPAGEIPASHGGTVAEWVECDPSAAVVEAVPFERLERSVVTPRDPDGVFQAVADGTVRPVAVAERRLVPCLDEFVAAYKAGEWDGLRDYVTDSSAEEASGGL